MKDKERISKILAHKGICSRREADYYIKRGWVFLEGQPVSKLGTQAPLHAHITLSPLATQAQQKKVSILLNKPLGYVSTQPEKGYKEALSLIRPERQDSHCPLSPLLKQHLKRLSVAGRLDINSKGLLVFTQDGCIAKQLIGQKSPIEKEYLVRFEGHLVESKLQLLRFGLSLDGKALKQARIERLNAHQLKMVLTEGKKRQIRRMLEKVDLKVIALKRTRVGRVCLGNLKEGFWRFLQENERF